MRTYIIEMNAPIDISRGQLLEIPDPEPGPGEVLVRVHSKTRRNGEELLREAARIPTRPEVKPYPFEGVKQAVRDSTHDGINGTVLVQISS